MEGDDLSLITKYIVNYSVYLNISATSNKIKVFYLGDMLTDNYNYLIYDNENCYISISENNLYVIDYTNGFLNIKHFDIFQIKWLIESLKILKTLN